jgi:hypothetical protein
MSNLQWVKGRERLPNAPGWIFIKDGHIRTCRWFSNGVFYTAADKKFPSNPGTSYVGDKTEWLWLEEIESPSSIEGEEKRPRWVKPENSPDKPGRYYAEYLGSYSDEIKRDMFYWNGGNWLTGPFKIVRWLSESPSPLLPVKEEENSNKH